MSYYLADATGYLRDFASIGGLDRLGAWAVSIGDSDIKSFFDTGEFFQPDRLAEKLSAARTRTTDPIVLEMLNDLIATARSANHTLILSDGVGGDDEPEALFSEDQEHDDHGRFVSGQHDFSGNRAFAYNPKSKEMVIGKRDGTSDWEAHSNAMREAGLTPKQEDTFTVHGYIREKTIGEPGLHVSITHYSEPGDPVKLSDDRHGALVKLVKHGLNEHTSTFSDGYAPRPVKEALKLLIGNGNNQYRHDALSKLSKLPSVVENDPSSDFRATPFKQASDKAAATVEKAMNADHELRDYKPTKELLATQDYVKASKVADIIKHGADAPATIARYRGQDHIADGHHRMTAALLSGSTVQVKYVNLDKKLRAAGPIKFTFDMTNPKAVEQVQQHAADLVTGISKTTREEIKDLVEEAFNGDYDVHDLADKIDEIIDDPDRADTIARTETMRASNDGQLAAWDQAEEEGLLTGNEQKEWITTPDERVCPVCEPMDGVTVPRDEDFDVNGDQLDGPPAHPNCRCTLGLKV